MNPKIAQLLIQALNAKRDCWGSLSPDGEITIVTDDDLPDKNGDDIVELLDPETNPNEMRIESIPDESEKQLVLQVTQELPTSYKNTSKKTEFTKYNSMKTTSRIDIKRRTGRRR